MTLLMFRIEVSDNHLSGTVSCPFCGVTQKWPFGGRFVWKGTPEQQVYPDARNAIFAHFLKDWNLDRFGYKACAKIGSWQDTTWERIDSDNGKLVDSGTVQMRQGWPSIR